MPVIAGIEKAKWFDGWPTVPGAYWMRWHDPARPDDFNRNCYDSPYLVQIAEDISTRKPAPLSLWKLGNDWCDALEDLPLVSEAGRIRQFCGPLVPPLG